jgi:hypothetical protein
MLHDGPQASRLTGPIAPEEHRHATAPHFEIDPMQNVISPNMGLNPGKAQ